MANPQLMKAQQTSLDVRASISKILDFARMIKRTAHKLLVCDIFAVALVAKITSFFVQKKHQISVRFFDECD